MTKEFEGYSIPHSFREINSFFYGNKTNTVGRRFMEFLLITSCLYSIVIIGLVMIDRHDERKFDHERSKQNK